MPRRYLIIGSGVAGVSAAQAVRLFDPAGEITMIGDDPYGFYSRPGLAYYLSGEVPEEGLFPIQEETFKSLHIKRFRGQMTRLDPAGHTAWQETGQALRYDRLLLATGGSAVLPQVPGMGLSGVVKLDHLGDAKHILELARKAKRAVVVGGGITALEIVEGLRYRGVDVHYFLRGDRYWNAVLDEWESHMVEECLKEEKVTIHYRTELAEIECNRGRVSGVLTKAGKRLACEMVAFAIGVKPRLDLARTAGLKVDRGILVDDRMLTSAEDIFAAGDASQVYDPRTGTYQLDTLWNLAREQGRTAGQNMAGSDRIYHRTTPFNVTRLAGYTTTIIGRIGREQDDDLVSIARGDSESWRYGSLPLPEESVDPSQGSNRLRLMMNERHLVGALVMGEQRISQTVRRLIEDQVDISSIRMDLVEPRSPLSDTLINFMERRRD